MQRNLRVKLIGAGSQGIPHSKLTQQCKTRLFSIDDIIEILEEWREKGFVQKFVTKPSHSKRPVTVWRATQLILGLRI